MSSFPEPVYPCVNLTDADEEKIGNIAEVCRVSREEALRVLEACHMDETMAIERFLSGNETSVWSQVPKRKKSSPRPTSRRHCKEKRERNRVQKHVQREKSTEPTTPSKAPGRSHHNRSEKHDADSLSEGATQFQQVRRREDASVATGKERRSPDQILEQGEPWYEQGDGGEGRSKQSFPQTPTERREMPAAHLGVNKRRVMDRKSKSNGMYRWRTHEPETAPSDVHRDAEPSSVFTPAFEDSKRKQEFASASVVLSAFNYAAAAAVGTSHARPSQKSSTNAEVSTSPPKSNASAGAAVVEQDVEGAPARTTANLARPETHHTQFSRASSEPEAQLFALKDAEPVCAPESLKSGRLASCGKVPHSNTLAESSTVSPNVWTPCRDESSSDEQRNEKQSSGSQVAAAVVSTEKIRPEQAAGDSLTLQFGSFGLSGLDAVNWSASEQKVHECVSGIVHAEPVSSPTESALELSLGENAKARPEDHEGSTPNPQPISKLVGTSPVRPSFDASKRPSSSLSASTAGPTSATGMFPILPVGPGGSFPPPSYGGPYLLPPLHGYTPALGSFENTTEVGSSRAPSIGPPGSLPPYDPAMLSNPGSTKFTGIPGLGEIPGPPVTPNQTVKGDGPVDSIGDKAATVGSSGLPGGVEPLTPYVLPGYPSIQYPVYAFPNAPYAAPPGMQPPGPNPFPFPPGGHVSSQATRGVFGYEDNSGGLGGTSRSGFSVGDSVYTTGGYLSSSVQGAAQKIVSDAAQKPPAGSNVGGVGVAGGIVHGMAYGDYSNAIPGMSNPVSSSRDGNASSWNRRQVQTERGDNIGATSIVQHSPAMINETTNLYVPTANAQGGALNAYWNPQQGGYYP